MSAASGPTPIVFAVPAPPVMGPSPAKAPAKLPGRLAMAHIPIPRQMQGGSQALKDLIKRKQEQDAKAAAATGAGVPVPVAATSSATHSLAVPAISASPSPADIVAPIGVSVSPSPIAAQTSSTVILSAMTHSASISAASVSALAAEAPVNVRAKSPSISASDSPIPSAALSSESVGTLPVSAPVIVISESPSAPASASAVSASAASLSLTETVEPAPVDASLTAAARSRAQDKIVQSLLMTTYRHLRNQSILAKQNQDMLSLGQTYLKLAELLINKNLPIPPLARAEGELFSNRAGEILQFVSTHCEGATPALVGKENTPRAEFLKQYGKFEALCSFAKSQYNLQLLAIGYDELTKAIDADINQLPPGAPQKNSLIAKRDFYTKQRDDIIVFIQIHTTMGLQKIIPADKDLNGLEPEFDEIEMPSLAKKAKKEADQDKREVDHDKKEAADEKKAPAPKDARSEIPDELM